MSPLLSENLKENVSGLCRRIADSRQIVAGCLYGPWVCGYADEKSVVDVLLILEGYPLLLNTYAGSVNGANALVLIVDRRTFERDVEQGRLCELLTEKITGPYEPLINEEYLQRQEEIVKKRIVSELLENLVSEFPELSSEFLIKREYFVYEVMMQRARLFPPITYTFLNMLRDDLRRKNIESMMKGYMKALNTLAKENKIVFSNSHIKITRSHINNIKRRKPRLPFFLRSIQRAALINVLSVLSKTRGLFIQDQRIFMTARRKIEVERPNFVLEEPKKHLLMATSLGFVSLSDKPTIEDFVRKTFPEGKNLNMRIKEMGGVLNDVYLLTLRNNHEEKKFVVKRFRDWSSFKWFPLALWSLGTKTFAVLGRSRLEREYATNKFLFSQGFPVPKILYVSPQKRLIFEDFIEGEKMVETIKRIISSTEKAVKEAALVKEVGRKIAEAHGLDVSLGDCKPENFLVAEEEKIFFVDLEQATRNGNQTWDLAEFLYYSGHYISPISSAKAASIITQNFIQGYLDAGGTKKTVKKAASARYIKVFSVFTSPHVIVAISNLCQKMGKN